MSEAFGKEYVERLDLSSFIIVTNRSRLLDRRPLIHLDLRASLELGDCFNPLRNSLFTACWVYRLHIHCNVRQWQPQLESSDPHLPMTLSALLEDMCVVRPRPARPLTYRQSQSHSFHPNSCSNTPLHLASAGGHNACVEYLLARIDKFRPDGSNRFSYLHCAA